MTYKVSSGKRGIVRYRAETHVPGLIEHMKTYHRVHITRGIARFRMRQYAEIEHVSNRVDTCDFCRICPQ